MVALNRDAPSITDHLCEACAAHFAAVRRTSTRWAWRTRVDPFLVRGLDYYTRTAFEFFPAGQRGTQGAIGGGGRYDRLVELLGGRPTPGIGFGLGLDRVILALDAEGVPPVEEPAALAVVVGADPRRDRGSGSRSPRRCARRGSRSAPTSCRASSAARSRRRRATARISR